jgi:hypothetical protein
MEKIIDFIKGNRCFASVSAMFVLVVCMLLYTNYKVNSSKRYVNEVEYIDSIGNYNKIYYEDTFSALKKENRELYDSLKQYRDRIDYLVEFTHEKEYNSGKVIVKHDTVYADMEKDSRTYTYTSSKNDTLEYVLKINSMVEPNWYEFQAKMRNKFTIVDKSDDDSDVSIVTIKPNNGGNVSNVTVFNKKEKKKLKDRFAIGPTVGIGYDAFHNDIALTVGVGITFDLTK